MYKLEPIALTAESENTYKVRFKTEAGEMEYRFTIHDDGFLSVGCDIPFSTITNDDPAVPLLTQAVANFHQARHFAYTQEDSTDAEDIRASRTDIDASKRASA